MERVFFIICFIFCMVNRLDGGSGLGNPLYVEKVAHSLRPRQKFAGRRWAFFEALARVFGLAFVIYAAYMAFFSDLRNMDNLVGLIVGIIGAITIFYATEVMTPRYVRNIMPMSIYRNGVKVYSSRLENLFGRPSFMPRESIRGYSVVRAKVMIDDELKSLPVELTFILKSGKKVIMGRRNVRELDTIIRLLDEKLEIREL